MGLARCDGVLEWNRVFHRAGDSCDGERVEMDGWGAEKWRSLRVDGIALLKGGMPHVEKREMAKFLKFEPICRLGLCLSPLSGIPTGQQTHHRYINSLLRTWLWRKRFSMF